MLGEPKANVRFVRFRPGFTPEWNVRVVLLSEVSSVVYVLGPGTGLSEFTLILVFALTLTELVNMCAGLEEF